MSTVRYKKEVKRRKVSPDAKKGQTRHATYYASAAVALAVFLVYLPALSNGFVNLDDDTYVVSNIHIRSLGWDLLHWAALDYRTNLWHPLTWLSHALDCALWGLKPRGHHLTSILLHAANSGIVVLLSILLLGTAREKSRHAGTQEIMDDRAMLIAGTFTGLLFGIHPLHVESVSWVAERKDVLYSLFYLLAMMSYIRFGLSAGGFGSKVPGKLNAHYYEAFFWFVLSLCSKPMAVTLPLVLMILDWYPLERVSTWRNVLSSMAEKLPFMLGSFMTSIITLLAQKKAGGLASLEDVPLLTRILVAFRSLLEYLWKMIAPINLLPFYPYPRDVTSAMPAYLAAVGLVALITAGCFLVVRKHPFVLAIWGYYIVSVFPVLGIAQAGLQAMADRFVYLPSLGMFLLAGIGIARLIAWKPRQQEWLRIHQWLLGAVVMAAVIILSSRTVMQIRTWENELVLWNHALEKGPRVYPWAWTYRGLELLRQGQIDKAIMDFTTAISQDPEHARAYMNRGVAYYSKGLLDASLADYDKAIGLRPKEYMAYINRGIAYYSKGMLTEALEDFNTAFMLNPGKALAYNNRGMVYLATGEFDRALEDLTNAIALSHDYADAYYNRSRVLMKRGDFAQAIADLNQVIQLQPLHALAFLNRGNIYRVLGNVDRANADYLMACSLGDERGCKKIAPTAPVSR